MSTAAPVTGAGRVPGIAPGLLVAGVLALQAVLLATHRVVIDDSYISFRYLDHWLGGAGLVFNVGERVEGYTNFLWIVALAPLRLAGLSPEAASLLLSLLSLGALLSAAWSTAAALTGGALGGLYAVTLLGASVNLAFWTGSGLETTFLAALLALANRELAVAGRHTVRSSLLFGLAVLTRPDALLFFAAAAAVFLPGGGGRAAVRRNLGAGLAFAALPALHLLFRLSYYGEWLPNTFHAKLGGVDAGLVPGGLAYAGRFLLAGGAVHLVAACLAAWNAKARGRVLAALALQALVQAAYVVRVGGDVFPYFRFLLPVLPNLAVLAGVGLEGFLERAGPRARRWAAGAAVPVAALALGLELRSPQEANVAVVRARKAEREAVARWLGARFKPPATLAVNAAGVIPYRTGLPTIDMLGLADRHIARAPVRSSFGGAQFLGHHKHDGAYVFGRRPDVVLTGGGVLVRAANAGEAVANGARATFEGDREFLRAPGADRVYRPLAEELAPGAWAVAYVRDERAAAAAVPGAPATAGEWLAAGIGMMGRAKYTEAIAAFREALALDPRNVAAMTNLAYCLHDLRLPAAAVPVFEEALTLEPDALEARYGLALALQASGDPGKAAPHWERYLARAPESVWKDNARRFLEDARSRRGGPARRP